MRQEREENLTALPAANDSVRKRVRSIYHPAESPQTNPPGDIEFMGAERCETAPREKSTF